MFSIVATMKSAAVVLATLLMTATIPARAGDETGGAIATTAAAAASVGSGYLDRARELAIQALALIGVNYKYGGNAPDGGFDCSGLVSHVFREVTGLVLPRDSQAMSKVGDKINKTELQPGDLVFFNTRRHPFSHVGIYIGEQRFVHAPSGGREVEISDLHSDYWQKRYNGARRVNF